MAKLAYDNFSICSSLAVNVIVLFYFVQVLLGWSERDLRTTQQMVDLVLDWRKRSFVSFDVWTGISKLVNFKMPVEPKPGSGVRYQHRSPAVLSERKHKRLQIF